MKDVSNQEGAFGFDRRAFVKRAGLASVGVAGRVSERFARGGEDELRRRYLARCRR